jgi:hypothetical protein
MPDLPLFVRYGVTDPRAVHLLLSGVRSRELATRIAAAAETDNVDQTELRAWLSQMSLQTWGSRFGAAPTDLADLLEYARPRGSKVLRTLLSEGTTTITVLPIQTADDQVTTLESAPPMASAGGDQAQGDLVLRRELGDRSPSPIAVFPAFSAAPVATIPISLHSEAQSILDTGLQLEIVLVGNQLTLSLEDQI